MWPAAEGESGPQPPTPSFRIPGNSCPPPLGLGAAIELAPQGLITGGPEGDGETSGIRDTPLAATPKARTSLPSPEAERCGWRGRSRPLPLPPPLPLLLLLSHAEHMVRDPPLLKSQRSCLDAAAWPPAPPACPSVA